MFFESHHSTERNFFKITVSQNTRSFSLHIHKAYELYAVTRGQAEVKIDGKKYLLLPGEAVLVFPYQSHEYKTEEGTGTWVCIFSPDLVGSYDRHNGNLPTDNKFLFSTDGITAPEGLLLQKSLCYDICGRFDEGREYSRTERAEASLISKLLTFISDNYRYECTLLSAAQHVGYDYNYISKLFKKTVKLSFNSYVNNLRISEACRLLTNTELSVQDIAEKCGYGCTRTFHREFLKIMKITPKKYRS